METIYRDRYNIQQAFPSRKRLIRTKPIVQAVMKQEKRNPRRSMRKTSSRLEISRLFMHKIF